MQVDGQRRLVYTAAVGLRCEWPGNNVRSPDAYDLCAEVGEGPCARGQGKRRLEGENANVP